MVAEQIAARGVTDAATLSAMQAVPRHRFVPRSHQRLAYADQPLPIGQDQTISQPYMVARMTELLRLPPGRAARVLEIGCGCGYQTAVLARLAARVVALEIVPELARATAQRLNRLPGVSVHRADGTGGWPAEAPYDAILVAAAPPALPAALPEQLKTGGRLVLPIGDDHQALFVFTKTTDGLQTERILNVRFVPMTGRAQELSEEPPIGSAE